MDLRTLDSQWPKAVKSLLADVHPVDRDALLIWLQLFPLSIWRLWAEDTGERAEFERYYQLRGRYRLADVADSSHEFLYGHRYWGAVKRALVGIEAGGDLEALIRRVAGSEKMALAIAAVAVMTVRQAGTAFLTSGYEGRSDGRSAEQVMAERASDQPRSLWGKLTGAKGGLRVSMGSEWFPILPGQHITTGAELDKRPYHEKDERCYKDMGPIPVDCRSGSCGTCWVGILGGREQTDPVAEFERKRMNYFGYWENEFHDGEAERPLIRLACQTIVRGSCRIVIPSWNGVLGEARRKRRGEAE